MEAVAKGAPFGGILGGDAQSKKFYCLTLPVDFRFETWAACALR